MKSIHFMSPSKWWQRQDKDAKEFYKTSGFILAIVSVFSVLMALDIIKTL